MTYDYVIGMDVGKYFHHACVLDIDGTGPDPRLSLIHI